jgi:hypothetical protein
MSIGLQDPRLRRRVARSALMAICLATASRAGAQAAPPRASPAPPDGRFVVEYYYKVRWGFQQEFIDLFRRNHLPLLLARVQRGTMVDVSAVAPRYHATEDGRWDYRVTIVFPNVAASLGDTLEASDRRRLYPDSVRFAREEARRFEILDAHWDVPIVPVNVGRQ